MAISTFVVLFALFAIAQSQTSTYSFSQFDSTTVSKFQLNGYAAAYNPESGNRLLLSISSPNTAGSAFLKNSIPLTGENGFQASFSTAFSFIITNSGGISDEDGVGADGLVFVINSVTNQVGSTGGGIGYQGVPRSVGIEFDTWNNGYPQDNDGNHIGIDINGDIVSVQQARYGTRMNDGQTKYAWIDFNGDTKLLEVRIANTNNRPASAFLARTVDLVAILQTASVYVGFTSAGGSAYGNHYITSWTFTNQYAPIIVTPPPVTAVCGNGVIEGSEVCDGGPCCSSTCTLLSSSTVCRSSTGTCDSTEFCTGSSPFCPLDTFASSSTVCRSSTGVCDPAETCTGTSATCPADSFTSSSTVCRASNGPCDAAETCTGSSGACPADSFQSSSTVCRASSGVCDVAETCSGSSAACPSDSFQSSSTVCRAASGVCDVAETCSGTSAACPSNTFLSSSTVCRPASGDCDVAETCSGASPVCPFDAFASSNLVCRDVNGPCDVAETCSGSSASCPSDSFKSTSAVCRASNGPCDVAETCSGTTSSCPADSFQPSTTVCRNANGICDVAETCSGSSSSCPVDGFASETTVCRSSNGVCDVAETCTGFGTECPVDSFAVASTVCRSSNGPCDIVETCTGTGVACPADAFQSSSTVCRASNGICDVAESCPGNGAACPTDSFKSSSTVCRASNGPCDAVETCSGSGSDCPTDAFQPTTTVCRASTGICDVDENCPGTGVLCPTDSFKSSSTVCRGSVGPCDPVETCTGNAGSCPADISGAFESECAGLHFNLGGSDYSFLDFNAISFNNFFAETGDVEGRVAVKNNVVLGNGYSVGYEVKPADGHKAFSLIAGGDVTWGSGSVGPSANTEDMFVGGSFSGPQYLSAQSVGGPCNAPGCLSSIFNAAQSCYGGYSTEMASHSDNVAKLLQWSGLYLTCNSNTEKTYYLSLEASELSQYTYVVADNCNNNARWVINFRGTGDISLSGGSFPANANAVIYNVIGSGRTINVNSIQLNGNLVAPYNTLSLSSGYIVGRTIVGDVAMQRSTQINRIPCFSQ